MGSNRMLRIINHWTGGGSRASAIDLSHYHFLVQGDCSIVAGDEEIFDNLVTSDGDYAAHTRRLNTGSIGVGLCGMMDAVERPFDAGPAPINEAQFMALCRLNASLCLEHGIAVTPQTVLTHAEVEPNLGVAQRGKWDIARLPWRSDIVGARAVGDYMRSIVAEMAGVGAPPENARPVLRFGVKGVAVAELQMDLASVGYFSGRQDADFGSLTRAAVLAFQADQGLVVDGVVGPSTWAALAVAEQRPLRHVDPAEIEASSGIASDARMSARTGDVVGLAGIGAVVQQVSTASGSFGDAAGVLERVTSVVMSNLPVFILGAVCLVAWFVFRTLSKSQTSRRVRDAREHRSLSR
jgi:hypothetical protein